MLTVAAILCGHPVNLESLMNVRLSQLLSQLLRVKVHPLTPLVTQDCSVTSHSPTDLFIEKKRI